MRFALRVPAWGAVGALDTAIRGVLRVDAMVAGLLEGRFEMRREGKDRRLVREIHGQEMRQLLGQPTRAVGRRRELALLRGTWDECVDDHVARAIVVIAPPGAGKSRLRWEFTRTVMDTSN